MDTCSVDACSEPRAKHRTTCRPHSRKQYVVTCARCGEATTKDERRKRPQFCSFACRDLWSRANGRGVFTPGLVRTAKHPREIPPKPEPIDQRSMIRIAIDERDREGFFRALAERVDVDAETGCWCWTGRVRDGYAYVRIGPRSHAVHRLVIEMDTGKALGKQAAHHMCANATCVNPDHLQPVTARENVAEMLARTYLESRIRDLESALADADPSHALLQEVGLATA